MSQFYSPRTSIIGLIKHSIINLCNAVCFAIENSKPRYPYTLVGEKHDPENQNTILYYRLTGKRHIFEISAKELCNCKELMERFHPMDIRTIAFISGIEQIIEIPKEHRLSVFNKLKMDVFERNNIK